MLCDKRTQERTFPDIKDLNKSPIEGAYYFPNEDNIMQGRALIFGPEGTPYEHGNYVFLRDGPPDLISTNCS